MQKVYEIVRKRDERINSYFKNLPQDLDILFKNILKALEIEIDKSSMNALKKRVFHLREDEFINILSKKYSKKEIEEIKLELYEFTKNFWIKEFETLLDDITPYLTPFYQTLLRGVHKIGIAISKWQPKWTTHIIHTINEDLSLEFAGDEAKVIEFLKSSNLDSEADRSYSVLEKYDTGYKVKTYYQKFKEEIDEIAKEIDNLILSLEDFDDEFKDKWILYFNTLKLALLEENRSLLIEKWAEVDRVWMDIKSPIQIGHPLEYYEDKYRKAVALEFDVRIQNISAKSEVKDSIVKMYKKYCKNETLLFNGLANISKTQLYISTPAMFYGAEFNGLFSAQVVPNDESVSKEKGKKIFAFVDKVYADMLARPKTKLSYEIFTKEFMDRFYENMKNKDIFFKVYDITTIGHEFGHILWMDEDSEIVMNKSGMFKNIEEFKATTGGIMAFFENEDESLKDIILDDIIKRAVGLIAWMEVDEVLPYYIEGLIHLEALFTTEVISFNGKELEYNYANYEKLKEWYKKTYLDLANFYIKKDDAKLFLDNFIYKDKNFYPKNKDIDNFVRYYYKRYKEIGSEIYED